MRIENELTLKAAWYYYIDGMTQQSISEKLGLSRVKVIRLLETARQTGIIQFKIRTAPGMNIALEESLTKKWGLEKAIVIPTPQNPSELNESIAIAAANYIADHLTNHAFINMGYGDTSSRMLNHLAAIAKNTFSVVSLTGGVSYYLPNTVSSIFNAQLHLFPAPLLISSQEAYQSILQEPSIQEVRRMIQLSTLSIVGIGGMSSNATIMTSGILSKNDFAYLAMKGAVGDILTHFIDKNGNKVQTSFDDRLVSTSLETLKSLQNVVGISGGPEKIEAIRAALRGQYLNMLITDEETAEELVKEDGGQ